MATLSSTLAWKIPWTEEPGGLQSMGSQRVGHDWVTSLSLFTFMYWRRKWQPTPVFLPGESQGWRSLVGCRLWGRTRVGHDWSNLAAAFAGNSDFSLITSTIKADCKDLCASHVALVVKNLPATAGDSRDTGLIPGLERFPGGGHDNPLWNSCLGNPIDRGSWQAAVHGPTGESGPEATQLSSCSCLCITHHLECLSVSELGLARLPLTLNSLLIVRTTSWPL